MANVRFYNIYQCIENLAFAYLYKYKFRGDTYGNERYDCYKKFTFKHC